jgi:serine/threonine protein kinase
MSETVARRKFWQIISAVEYCHQRRIVHRDLKVCQPLLYFCLEWGRFPLSLSFCVFIFFKGRELVAGRTG